MSLKTTKIIDLNLFSGSSEALRQVASGYYGDLVGTGDINFSEANISLNIGGVESIDYSSVQTIADNLLPVIKYASRLYVDQSSNFSSDEDWKTFIMGGTFGDITYPGLYNDFVYADHMNTSSLPYLPREIVNIDSLLPSLSLTTEYYNYYPRFQSEIQSLNSEIEAPNYYMLPSNYLSQSETPNSSIAENSYLQMEDFLADGFVNSTKVYDEKLENIFVLQTGVSFFNELSYRNSPKRNDLIDSHIDSDLQKLFSLMPFGNKLQIEEDLADSGNNSFKTQINAHQYKLKFIKLLKEIFQGESSLQPSTINFAVNTEAESSTGVLTGSLETTTTVPIRLIDPLAMLLYAYKNPLSETDNITIIQSSSVTEQMDYVFDTVGTYRYENTQQTLKVLNGFVQVIENNFGDGSNKTYPLNEFLNQAGVSKYHETVAFRIEKIGGQPTGDARTENTIQNIWFYNSNDAITYLDTQVKYNTEYTYKVYKYDIVQGYKYQLSDALTTRQIAVTSSGESNVYCLEFYDPITNQVSSNLLNAGNALGTAETRKDFLETSISELDAIAGTGGGPALALDSTTGLINTLQIFVDQLGGATALADTTLYTESDTRIQDNPSFFEEYLPEIIEGSEPIIAFPYYIRYVTSLGAPSENIDSFTYSRVVYGDDVISGPLKYEGRVSQGDLFYINLSNRIEADEAVAEIMQSLEEQIEAFGEIVLNAEELLSARTEELSLIESFLAGDFDNSSFTSAQINSYYPYLADFNITIEPSLKIVEIPLEEKRMRIVDHPPNDFVVTPHHLLDQSNRLAFYCKYDTFSQNAVTYPTALNTRDTNNKTAYLTGNDFLEVSEQTQESVSRPRFIEVYRTTTKPTSYDDFSGNLRTTIDLKQENSDIPTDHLFVERVRDNTIYYYVFRSLNENGVAGQFSPVFESELINDGGYVYGRFQQHSEDDLAVTNTKDPLSVVKKLFNIVPNMQHLVLDSSNVDLDNPAVSEIDNVSLGSSNLTDPLFTDANRYFKIRLTSKKTGRKLDINIGFKKEVRK